MSNQKQLSDIDIFFFFGDNDLGMEVESELLRGILQPKRSMFYNREEGAGVKEYENRPSGITLDVGVRYDIANWVSQNNARVTDGSEGYPDRRIAVSQNTINVERKNGQVNIDVLYIPFFNYEKPNVTSVQAGVVT